jgi:hypothetical protein
MSVFYTNPLLKPYPVEVLSKGPASERDIKTAVLERCKEHSIRPSNRGLIAGTGMDVATVCRVLFALGLVETGGCERNEDEVDFVAYVMYCGWGLVITLTLLTLILPLALNL